MAAWTDRVDNAGIPLSQVQTAFVNSGEALDNVAPIVEMYQAHLGRVPEQAALAYWVSVLESGTMTVAQIGLAIAGSAESQTYFGAFDDGFVATLYEKILGREPEDGSLAYWQSMKTSGMTQAQMQEAFRSSAEAGSRAASAVTSYLTSIALEDPNAYSGSLYSLGRTITLTTGHDYGATFSGTTGNDIFQAVEDTTSGPAIPTWTTADAIDGGAGVNTLNVTQTAAISGAPLNATVTNIQTANVIDAATVTLDTTGWAGLADLNVTDVGATSLTAAGTTGVTVTDTAGAVTITGGSTQSVTTSAGAVTLSGATGAIAVTETALGGNTLTINGGSSVTVTASGESTSNGAPIAIGNITAPTGAVAVTVSSNPTATSNGSLGTITVRGGSTINVTENVLGAVNHTFTAGSIYVTGTADTTSVSTSETARATAGSSVTGVNNSNVAVADVNGGSSTLAGTITSISASNYTTLSIQDNALTTLSLAGGSGNIIVDNSGLDTPTITTLAVTIDGQTGGTLDDADIYQTLNVTTANTNSTLANITFGALHALSVAGTKRLTLTSTAGMSGLHTVAVLGAAGLTADLSAATVTAIDTSATTGASTMTMDGSRATFTGGAGADSITLAAIAPNKAISLGGGDDRLVLGSLVPTAAITGGLGTDTLSMTAANAATASGSGTFASLVNGFENLIVTGATNQTIDLAILGIPNAVQTSGGNGLTLSNLITGGTLTLNGAGTAYTIGNLDFGAGVNDTINLVLTDGSGAGVSYATTGITAFGVENFAITTVDTQATPTGTFNDLVTLLGNSAKTITVTGNAGLNLTATSTRLTSLDASGIGLGGFSWTSGALAAAAAIKGSATGTNTVDFSAATGGVVTYTGGSGDDAATGTNGKSNVVSLGEGTNSYTGSGGNQTVTGGSGADTVVATSGNNIVSLGDGTNAFTATSGNNTYTGGSGADTVTLGGGINTVTLGAGSNILNLTAPGATLGTYTTILDPTAGDTISFANLGTETFNATKITLDPGALLQQYADAVAVGGGNSSVNGHLGWFQFGGDTFLVESRHDASGVAAYFLNGTDCMVKLAGAVDLSTATFNGTQALVLT